MPFAQKIVVRDKSKWIDMAAVKGAKPRLNAVQRKWDAFRQNWLPWVWLARDTCWGGTCNGRRCPAPQPLAGELPEAAAAPKPPLQGEVPAARAEGCTAALRRSYPTGTPRCIRKGRFRRNPRRPRFQQFC